MIATNSTSPLSAISSLIVHRGLVKDLVMRDFIGRYKGSFLGVAWSLFNPLLMLIIYTLVFTVAFKSRWGTGEESKVSFAVILFAGLIVHGLFAECLNRAPTLITSNANYVKKVVFPLEILPWMALCSALLHFGVSLGILFLACVLIGIPVHAGTILLPLLLLPMILMTLGLSWILASLGVFLRDLPQAINVVTTVALFMAPVFYPIETLPERYRELLAWNPITLPIVHLREVLLWEGNIRWGAWVFSLVIGAAISMVGYWWFQKSRPGFADVL